MTPHSPTMLNPVEMVTAAIANNPLPVISSDPSLTLGPDLTIEEKPVVFQEGDSMQVRFWFLFGFYGGQCLRISRF